MTELEMLRAEVVKLIAGVGAEVAEVRARVDRIENVDVVRGALDFENGTAQRIVQAGEQARVDAEARAAKECELDEQIEADRPVKIRIAPESRVRRVVSQFTNQAGDRESFVIDRNSPLSARLLTSHWNSLLSQDADLAAHLASGALLVEPLPRDEARRFLKGSR